MSVKKHILPIIISSQLLCTSMWFAGNSVVDGISKTFGISNDITGSLLSSVQLGFILGTLIFAFFCIADRFKPSRVFACMALFGALVNLAITFKNNTEETLLLYRFFTGFSLAGIYPVGMKIASDYYKDGLGKALSYLVGALVLGTAAPHLINYFTIELNWNYVFYCTSFLASIGGLLILFFVPTGPYCKENKAPEWNEIFKVFKNKKLKSAAFGYFGHMWELYAFWVFVPTLLVFFKNNNDMVQLNVPLYTFLIIASGTIGCILGSYLSKKIGVKNSARLFLAGSCACCLLSPVMLHTSFPVFIIFLVIWGMLVIADSPLFSTLVASYANPKTKGTALTLVNSIGFSISIISIELLQFSTNNTNSYLVFTLLGIGPLLGLTQLYHKKITHS